MSTIVSKFGGSSIADAECFRRVLNIVSTRKHNQFIILSAPGKRNAADEKITDLLVRAHSFCTSGKDNSALLEAIRQRFTQIIRGLALGVDPVLFLSTLNDDVRQSADHAASRGEYLCARLFAAYASLPFVDASELIHFDTHGRIMRDRIAQSVCRMADRYPCAIVPGFYGSMPDGSIKTFTRGGSDITGALIAAALHADIYENWTDVDGLMSADPAVCSSAVCHPAVSYRQMRMLAKSGAKVLHPYCVEPVCEAGIPTVLKNTFAPERPGTYISDHVRRSVPCVCTEGGYAAVALDALSKESRHVADGLVAEKYISQAQQAFIALKTADHACGGTPASIISAFGLTASLRHEASQQIAPIAELHTEFFSKYLVERSTANEAQRTLHTMIMRSATASRTPLDCAEPCHPTP